MNKKAKRNLIEFDNAFTNGTFVEPLKIKKGYSFKLREAIKKVEQLGRPLTDEEMKEYEIKLENRKETSK